MKGYEEIHLDYQISHAVFKQYILLDGPCLVSSLVYPMHHSGDWQLPCICSDPCKAAH